MMILEGLAMRPDKHDMQCDHCGSDNDNLKKSAKTYIKIWSLYLSKVSACYDESVADLADLADLRDDDLSVWLDLIRPWGAFTL